MAHWHDEYSILRDLSEVQGNVPAKCRGAVVGAGDKPPSFNVTEETEEEFYKVDGGGGDGNTAPDFQVIKQMLDMVRDTEILSDNEEDKDKGVVISKPNTYFDPTHENTSTPLNKSPEKKKKKKPHRNIAVESILQTLADNENKNSQENTTVLRKPNDFIRFEEVMVTNTEKIEDKIDMVATTTEKINSWFETHPVVLPKRSSKIVLEPSNVTFKKKNNIKERVVTPVNVQKSPLPPQCNVSEYKPSNLANDYYLKYVEQKKNDHIKDTIWTVVEKKMKEIEEKKVSS